MSSEAPCAQSPAGSRSTLAIVVPVFRNAETLATLSERLDRALAGKVAAVELIFVVDGCPGSHAEALRLARQEPWISSVVLEKNCGQQQAILAGLKRAEADLVAVMDADLQDPPEALPLLVATLEELGTGVVFAARQGGYQSWGRMLSSSVFKWILRRATGLPRGAGCFLVMSAAVRSAVIDRESPNFYLLSAIARSGCAMAAIDVARARRPIGKSAYRRRDRVKVALSHFKDLLR